MKSFWKRMFTRNLNELQEEIQKQMEEDNCVAANVAYRIDQQERVSLCLAMISVAVVGFGVVLILALQP